jgi:hypothetical protein
MFEKYLIVQKPLISRFWLVLDWMHGLGSPGILNENPIDTAQLTIISFFDFSSR